MIDPKPKDIGRKVIYTPSREKELIEEGVITSITKDFVFVRYGSDTFGKATKREALSWLFPEGDP